MAIKKQYSLIYLSPPAYQSSLIARNRLLHLKLSDFLLFRKFRKVRIKRKLWWNIMIHQMPSASVDDFVETPFNVRINGQLTLGRNGLYFFSVALFQVDHCLSCRVRKIVWYRMSCDQNCVALSSGEVKVQFSRTGVSFAIDYQWLKTPCIKILRKRGIQSGCWKKESQIHTIESVTRSYFEIEANFNLTLKA